MQKRVAELNTMIQNLYEDVLPERQVWRMIQYDEEQIKTPTSYDRRIWFRELGSFTSYGAKKVDGRIF